MRKIEFREIFRTKCWNCGCKNKLHTVLLDENNKFVGYALKCCNCGKYTEYLLDTKNNGIPHASYKPGFQSCIQPSFCPFSGTICKVPKFNPHNIDPKPPQPLPPCEKCDRCATTTEYVHEDRFV